MELLELARFWSRVEGGNENACWPWMGRMDTASGYGRTPDGERAHRAAYRSINGEIPEGMLVRHLCHNKRCCNPKHLECGTWLENAADEVAAGKTLKGERNGRAKLTETQIEHIRTSKKTGVELAVQYGVAESTISYVRSRRSWK